MEELEGHLKAVQTRAASVERRITLLSREGAGPSSQGANLLLPASDDGGGGCGAEGTLVEQYGHEVRTTFIGRGDGLRLRITDQRKSVVYDSFEQGRDDCLHTFTAKAGGYSSLAFFDAREDTAVSYARVWEDDAWCFRIAHSDRRRAGPGAVVERAVALRGGVHPAPLDDTPSQFRARIASVEVVRRKGAGLPVRVYKDLVCGRGRVWREREGHAGDEAAAAAAATEEEEEEEELAAYALDAYGGFVGVEATAAGVSRQEAEEVWEQTLELEAETVAMVMHMERYHNLFMLTHIVSEPPVDGGAGQKVVSFAESQPARISALSEVVQRLYATMDADDHQFAQHSAAQAAQITKLEAEVLVRTFDPKATL